MKSNGGMHSMARSLAFAVLRHAPGLRLKVRRGYWWLQRRRYERLWRDVAVDSRQVFFESYGGRSVSCSPKSLFEAMAGDERYRGYRFVWSVREGEREQASRVLGDRARIVIRGSGEYYDALAGSGTLMLNTRLPEYVWPREGQTYVQCWHGTPLKRLGYDVRIETSNALNTTSELAMRFGLDARKWTYLLSPSAYATRHLCDAFGLPAERRGDVVIEEGYPRNDALYRADEAAVAAIRKRLRLPEDRKVLLYAPTWRDDQYRSGVGYTFDYLLDFDRLQRELGDAWVVLFRAHYYIANQFDFSKYRGFVVDVSDVDDINDLYLASDAMVTDYSSVMFDYANTGKPMVLFVPDRKHYDESIRGFYLDFDSIPAPMCETSDQMVKELRALDSYNARYGDAYRTFRETYCPHDDGHAAERVLARVFG